MKRFKRNQLEISSSQGKKKKKKKINLTAVMLQPSSLTFHHLHILQRKLPEELVFTGGVDRTCCWISERQQTKENMLFIYYKEYNNDKYYNNPRGSLEQLQHDTSLLICVLSTYRLMELRLNEPDFLLSVVQMIRSLKRNRERSFFPPTVFCRARMVTRRC